MDRRQFTRLACQAGIAATLFPARAQDAPVIRIAAAQIQEGIATRFPMKHPVGNLFDLTLAPPAVRLMPQDNRLGAAMDLAAAGPALHRRYTGLFDLDFGLRYEAADKSIRARDLRVNALRLDSLSGEAARIVNAYGPALAQEALADAVLYKLEPKDLLLVDGLGLQPGEFKVTEGGIVVSFVSKPL
ncbi:MAG: DUF1439 domain-containing protein [Burkholderiaceae bacterium]